MTQPKTVPEMTYNVFSGTLIGLAYMFRFSFTIFAVLLGQIGNVAISKTVVEIWRFNGFYTRALAVVVRLSVRLSQVSVLLKWLKVGSYDHANNATL